MELDDLGVRALAAAILLQAAKDWQDAAQQRDIRAFLQSGWGRTVLEELGLGDMSADGVIECLRKHGRQSNGARRGR